jgi:hypothetical protein
MIARWTTYDGDHAVERFDALIERALAERPSMPTPTP